MVLAKPRSSARAWPRAFGAAFLLAIALSGPSAAAPETLTVHVDQATLMKLPDKVATLVIGNPLIADVAVQAGGMAVVTGKGYGSTNLIALDRSGATLAEKSIVVLGPRDRVVVVYRGVERETYSCTPNCERRITLGDTPTYFDATLGQSGSRNGQAAGGQAAPAR
jgi:Flp pilus assembly secretin CpaC